MLSNIFWFGTSVFDVIVLQVAWLTALSICFFAAVYYYRVKAYKNTLDDAIDIIEQITGYREELADKVAMYSKMKSAGVTAPVTNAIISLAQELKNSDSIFLIRIAHDEDAWYIRMAGKPVHLNQALFVMDLIKERVKNTASETGFIFKKRDGVIN
jgi:hypothetical protein